MAVTASGQTGVSTGRVVVLGPRAWAEAVAAVLGDELGVATACRPSERAPADVVVLIGDTALGAVEAGDVLAGARTLLLTDGGDHGTPRAHAACDAVLDTGCSVPELARVVASLLAGEHLRTAPARRRHDLTEREAGVLALVAEGCSDHDIAAELGLSIHTVRTHLQRTRLKVGARNRLHLMAMARRGGLEDASS